MTIVMTLVYTTDYTLMCKKKNTLHFDILTYFKKELIIVSTKLTNIGKYFH